MSEAEPKYEIMQVWLSAAEDQGDLQYAEGLIDIGWTAKGIGIGHLSFRKDGDLIVCGNEAMSRDFVKAVLVKLADVAVLDVY